MTSTASDPSPSTEAIPHEGLAGDANAHVERTKLPPVVWMLGAVAFIMGTSEFMVSGLLPQISAALDVSVSSGGALITTFALGMMVGAPIMSIATQRLPRRFALITALLVFASGHVIGALSTSLELATVGRFAAALGNGTFWAVGAVVATAAAGPAASARAMGVMVGGITLANIVGVPLGTASGQLSGWQAPFWALAVLAVAAAVIIARRLPAEESRQEVSLRPETAALGHPRLWLVYATIALLQAAVMATFSYVVPLLTERAHLATALVPLALLGYGIGALIGSTLGGRLGDHKPYAAMISATALTAVLLVAIAVWATSPAVAFILIVLLGGASFTANPIVVGQVVHIAGTGRSLPMALATSAFQIGIAAGSWIGGVALTSALGLAGPSVLGTAIALSALIPLGLLAMSETTAAGNRW